MQSSRIITADDTPYAETSQKESSDQVSQAIDGSDKLNSTVSTFAKINRRAAPSKTKISWSAATRQYSPSQLDKMQRTMGNKNTQSFIHDHHRRDAANISRNMKLFDGVTKYTDQVGTALSMATQVNKGYQNTFGRGRTTWNDLIKETVYRADNYLFNTLAHELLLDGALFIAGGELAIPVLIGYWCASGVISEKLFDPAWDWIENNLRGGPESSSQLSPPAGLQHSYSGMSIQDVIGSLAGGLQQDGSIFILMPMLTRQALNNLHQKKSQTQPEVTIFSSSGVMLSAPLSIDSLKALIREQGAVRGYFNTVLNGKGQPGIQSGITYDMPNSQLHGFIGLSGTSPDNAELSLGAGVSHTREHSGNNLYAGATMSWGPTGPTTSANAGVTTPNGTTVYAGGVINGGKYILSAGVVSTNPIVIIIGAGVIVLAGAVLVGKEIHRSSKEKYENRLNTNIANLVMLYEAGDITTARSKFKQFKKEFPREVTVIRYINHALFDHTDLQEKAEKLFQSGHRKAANFLYQQVFSGDAQKQLDFAKWKFSKGYYHDAQKDAENIISKFSVAQDFSIKNEALFLCVKAELTKPDNKQSNLYIINTIDQIPRDVRTSFISLEENKGLEIYLLGCSLKIKVYLEGGLVKEAYQAVNEQIARYKNGEIFAGWNDDLSAAITDLYNLVVPQEDGYKLELMSSLANGKNLDERKIYIKIENGKIHYKVTKDGHINNGKINAADLQQEIPKNNEQLEQALQSPQLLEGILSEVLKRDHAYAEDEITKKTKGDVLSLEDKIIVTAIIDQAVDIACLSSQEKAVYYFISGRCHSETDGFNRDKVLFCYLTSHKEDQSYVPAAILLAEEYCRTLEYSKAKAVIQSCTNSQTSEDGKKIEDNKRIESDLLTLKTVNDRIEIKSIQMQLLGLAVGSFFARKILKSLHDNHYLDDRSTRITQKIEGIITSCATRYLHWKLQGIGKQIQARDPRKTKASQGQSPLQMGCGVVGIALQIGSLLNELNHDEDYDKEDKKEYHKNYKEIDKGIENCLHGVDIVSKLGLTYDAYQPLADSVSKIDRSALWAGNQAELDKLPELALNGVLFVSPLCSLARTWYFDSQRNKGNAPTNPFAIMLDDSIVGMDNVGRLVLPIYQHSEALRELGMAVATYFPAQAQQVAELANAGWEATKQGYEITKESLKTGNPYVIAVGVVVGAGTVIGGTVYYFGYRRPYQNELSNIDVKIQDGQKAEAQKTGAEKEEIEKYLKKAKESFEIANNKICEQLGYYPTDAELLYRKDKLRLLKHIYKIDQESVDSDTIVLCDTRIDVTSDKKRKEELRRYRLSLSLQRSMQPELSEEEKKKLLDKAKSDAEELRKSSSGDVQAYQAEIFIYEVEGKFALALNKIADLRKHISNKEDKEKLNKREGTVQEAILLTVGRVLEGQKETFLSLKGVLFSSDDASENSSSIFQQLDASLIQITENASAIHQSYLLLNNPDNFIKIYIRPQFGFYAPHKRQWTKKINTSFQSIKNFIEFYGQVLNEINSVEKLLPEHLEKQRLQYEKYVDSKLLEIIDENSRRKIKAEFIAKESEVKESVKEKIEALRKLISQHPVDPKSYEDFERVSDENRKKIDSQMEEQVTLNVNILWTRTSIDFMVQMIEQIQHITNDLFREIRYAHNLSLYFPLPNWRSGDFAQGVSPFSQPQYHDTPFVFSKTVFWKQQKTRVSSLLRESPKKTSHLFSSVPQKQINVFATSSSNSTKLRIL